jgi:hypothetical protein
MSTEWMDEALADTDSPDTAEDLGAILEAAWTLVNTDSISERQRYTTLLRTRLGRLKRIYERPNRASG